MEVAENIVTVDGWEFEIDRSIPEITQSLGKETEFKATTKGKAKFVYDAQTGNVAKVDVTIEIDASISGYTVQYNLKDKEDASADWTDYTVGSTIEVRKNITIYGRIIDKTTNEVGYKFSGKITTIDETAPQTATITFDKLKANVGEIIKATVTQYDNETGIDATKCSYIVNTSKDEIGKDSSLWNNAIKFTTNPQVIDIKQSAGGKYYLHVLSSDEANNLFETVSDEITFKAKVYYLNVGKSTSFGGNWTTNVKYSAGWCYELNANQKFYATYNQLVDISDLESINFYDNLATTGGAYNVQYSLRLVSQPRATTAVKEASVTKKSSSGGAVGKVELSMDVSEITR